MADLGTDIGAQMLQDLEKHERKRTDLGTFAGITKQTMKVQEEQTFCTGDGDEIIIPKPPNCIFIPSSKLMRKIILGLTKLSHVSREEMLSRFAF